MVNAVPKGWSPEERDAMAFRVMGDRAALDDPRAGVYLNQLVSTTLSHHGIGKTLLDYLSNPLCAIAPAHAKRLKQEMGNAASPFPALVKKAFTLYLRGLRQQMTLKSPTMITSGAWTVFEDLETIAHTHKTSAFSKHVPWDKLQGFAGPRMVRALYKDLQRFPAIRDRIATGKNINRADLNSNKALKNLAQSMVDDLHTSLMQTRKKPHTMWRAVLRR